MLRSAIKISRLYTQILRFLVFFLLSGAGLGIFVMILTICADVVLRQFGISFVGAYDIVKIAGALTLAMALPYTTAIKGHVAIEYFFHKFTRKARMIIDSCCRILGIMLFAFLGFRCFVFGSQLYDKGQVTQTLQLPIFWVPYIIGFCVLVVACVILHHLVHPNREMIKP